MNCSKHTDREAKGMCVKCKSFVCEECEVKIDSRIYCKSCVEGNYTQSATPLNMEKPNVSESNVKVTNNDPVRKILGGLMLILAAYRLFDVILNIPNIFNGISWAFEYQGFIVGIVYTFYNILHIVIPAGFIVLGLHQFKEVIKIDKKLLVGAPFAILLFQLVVFCIYILLMGFFEFDAVINAFTFLIKSYGLLLIVSTIANVMEMKSEEIQ